MGASKVEESAATVARVITRIVLPVGEVFLSLFRDRVTV